jgi:hypothetical protein
MVDDIAAQWNGLHSPTCRADMDGANAVVTTQRHLDGLYQHALAYATHMYCRQILTPSGDLALAGPAREPQAFREAWGWHRQPTAPRPWDSQNQCYVTGYRISL